MFPGRDSSHSFACPQTHTCSKQPPSVAPFPLFIRPTRQEKRTNQCFRSPTGPGLCLQWSGVDGWEAGSQQMKPHYTCKSEQEINEHFQQRGTAPALSSRLTCLPCSHVLSQQFWQSHWAGRRRKPWVRELQTNPRPIWEGGGQSGKSPPLCVWSSKLVCPADVGPLISYCRNCSLLLAINWRMRKWATWKKEWEWVSMKKNWCFSNCGAGEDSWESLGLQGDQTSQS